MTSLWKTLHQYEQLSSSSICESDTSSQRIPSYYQEEENKKRIKILFVGTLKVTHPPTPVDLSLECGALSGSIAVTSFFLGSFHYSPDKVCPSQVFPRGSREELKEKQN